MTSRPQDLVQRFYDEVWKKADESVAREILDQGFRFRGSLGPERIGPDGFIGYMRSVHAALADFRCIVEDLVVSGNRAAARMRFTGIHQATFFDIDATHREISWAGAAFFETDGSRITELWVLGDVDSVRRQLGSPAQTRFSSL